MRDGAPRHGTVAGLLDALRADSHYRNAADDEYHRLDPAAVRQVERDLSDELGWQPATALGRRIVRPLSSRLGRWLARHHVPLWLVQPLPVAVLVTAAALVARHPEGLAIGGVLFLLATILDHAALDQARLLYRDSERRQLLAAVGRYMGYGAFFVAAGLNAYQHGGPQTYIYAIAASVCMWGYLTLLMIRLAANEGSGIAEVLDTIHLHRERQRGTAWINRITGWVGNLLKPDAFPVLVPLFALSGMAGPLFWFSGIALTGILIALLRLASSGAESKAISRSATTFLFYTLGVLIVVWLVTNMPIADLRAAIETVGPSAAWLLLMPVTWAIPFALTLWILLDRRVSFRDTLYTQVTGDAFNNIIPLMGLGGEPYKVSHLSKFIPIEDASRAIVESRLIHALSGVLFTALVLGITPFSVELEPGMAYGLGILSGLMVVAAIGLVWITRSQVPSRATGFVLNKLKLTDDIRAQQLNWRKLNLALLFKLIGRSSKFVELWLIFLLLGYTPSFGDVVLVEAAIMGAASIFFVMPQGLGVHELGITQAFRMLGLSAADGLAFGLIRRARVVSYALTGLMILLVGRTVGFGSSRFREARESESQSSTRDLPATSETLS
ncbi:MAG: UPF0104 family protein [Candidatus Dadabacteria bacterium]|nr:MAG: UPF0104 family protein [Candidatus Dadabacteria bacterium]